MRRRQIRTLLAALTIVLVEPAAAEPGGLAPLPAQPEGTAWPTIAWPESTLGTSEPRILEAVEHLFSFGGRGPHPDTRGFLIIHRGTVVHERYAEGFDPSSRFRSWSAAKSVTQALTALLVRQGRLDLDAPARVPEWRGSHDPRRALTPRHLLHMNTGLDNGDGDAEPASYVAKLLFGHEGRDSGAFAAQARLVHEPGSHWAYSTATSQILSRIVAREVGGGRAGMLEFVERELAAPLGIDSLVVEFDPSGTPLGGGFVWMSARDWARLGLLYLRDGNWDGRRLLPEGWVDFTRTRAPAANNAVFGAHFWIGGAPRDGQPPSFDVSLGSFQMSGNGGQFVVMFPSRDLIVVRLGEMSSTQWGDIVADISAIAERFPEVMP